MKLFKKINLDNIHVYFFYLFLFSIPFQTRKVFLTEYSFYSGEFTEWTTFFLYASDIFLILMLIFWIISVLRLKNNKIKKLFLQLLNSYKKFKKFLKSIIFVIPAKAGIQNLTQKNSFKNVILAVLKNFLHHNRNTLLAFLRNKWLFLSIFLVWLALNLTINSEYFAISAFQFVKFIELSLLIIFVYFSLRNNKTILTKSLFVLIFSGFLQSIIAIYQFILQHSVFTSPILAKIIGEPVIGPQILGVAKIVVDGDKIIRAYGTFPHPNVLGGFLVFTILITIYLYLEYKKDYLSSAKLNLEIRNSNALANLKRYLRLPSLNFLCRYFYSTNGVKSQVYINSSFWIFLIFIQLVGLFFTFSRSAWLGLLISLLIMSVFYFYKYQNVSRETFYNNNGLNKNNLTAKRYQNNFSLESIFEDVFIKLQNYILVLKNKIVSRETIKNAQQDKKVSNIENKQIVSNNITLLNKLSTAFQHNFYTSSIIRYKELFIAFIAIVIIIGVNFSLISNRFDMDLHNENLMSHNSAINERFFYNNVSRETISNNLIFGSGIGTSIFQIDNYIKLNKIGQKLQSWQYQPAHNIYLLIASEIGIVGLILFLLFIMNILYNLLQSNFNVSGKRKRYYITPSSSSFLRMFYDKINTSFKIINKIVSRETLFENYISKKSTKKSVFLIPAKEGNRNLTQKTSFKNSILAVFQNFLKPKSKFVSRETIVKDCSFVSKGSFIGICEEYQKYNLTTDTIVSRETIVKDYSSIDKGRLERACNVSRETLHNDNLNIYLFTVLIAFLFISLFDHYFWTIQQGRLMFWLVLGFILALLDRKE